jgi:hypothetical protein
VYYPLTNKIGEKIMSPTDNNDLLKEVGMTQERKDELTIIFFKISIEEGTCKCPQEDIENISEKELLEFAKSSYLENLIKKDESFEELSEEEVVAFQSFESFKKEFNCFFAEEDDKELQEGLRKIKATREESLAWFYVVSKETFIEAGLL